MKPDLASDLLSSETIINKCKHSTVYSQNLYAAMCNNRFFYGEHEWTCSWRVAGGIVADIRDLDIEDWTRKEDYMDWYCSGMADKEGYVSEGVVTDEISLDLMKLGWIIKPYEPRSLIYKNIW